MKILIYGRSQYAIQSYLQMNTRFQRWHEGCHQVDVGSDLLILRVIRDKESAIQQLCGAMYDMAIPVGENDEEVMAYARSRMRGTVAETYRKFPA